jgi:AcrR family transcriptional regulator
LAAANGAEAKGAGAAGKAAAGARREQILETAAQLVGTRGARTSVQEIAKACGILPGSLYHHFESKEAILVELVRRYQADLDEIAGQALEQAGAGEARSVREEVMCLARAIADCAVRHRAAFLQTLYEPAANASDELVALTRRPHAAVDRAMLEILRAGRAGGLIRDEVDLALLADRICQAMLAVSLGLAPDLPGAHEMPTLKCRMLLDGLAAEAPRDADLDRSEAFAVAGKVIADWDDDDEEGRAGRLRRAARREFGRRGFEATTIRDIAAAADMSPSMAHHIAGSKEELLASIMQTYTRTVAVSWDAVLAASGSPVEKLDALTWIDINVMDRFSDEFKIQMASLQQAPPSATDPGPAARPARLAALMAEGEAGGDLRVLGGSAELRAHGLLELMWISERIVRSAGPRAALALARATLLRGACTRPSDAGR